MKKYLGKFFFVALTVVLIVVVWTLIKSGLFGALQLEFQRYGGYKFGQILIIGSIIIGSYLLGWTHSKINNE